MPVDFLTIEQKSEYGQFTADPNDMQLGRYFHFDETDLTIIFQRRGEANRLGFALQLTSARFLGTFLSNPIIAPYGVKVFVAQQLSIDSVKVLDNYSRRETTKWEHTALIRKLYGYHEFNDPPWAFRLIRVLYTRAWINNERPSLMFDFATTWLIKVNAILFATEPKI